jgi:hypothetical protein
MPTKARNPRRRAGGSLAFGLLLAVGSGLAGCAKPAARSVEGAPPPASEPAGAPGGEAAKSQELEQKAQEYQDRFAEIQASELSAEEKAAAASALVDEQQKTIQEAESGDSGESPD